MVRAARVSIRPAAAADLSTLLELYRHLNHGDPKLGEEEARRAFSVMLAHPGMTVLASFDGEIAVSSVTLVVIPNLTRSGAPYALIENVVTHGDYRKRGHAGSLIQAAAALAWDSNCYKVMLLTGSTDPATLRFYEGCGFLQNKTGFQMRRPQT